MKRTVAILFIAAILCCCFAGCGDDSSVEPDQRDNILRYLASEEMTFTINGGVYRHVANADRDDYLTSEIADIGDSVIFMFEAYLFNTAPTSLYFTNKKYLVDADTIINPMFWSFDPMRVRLGSTSLIRGLTRGLEGCRQGDSVLLFFTSNLGYSNKPVGVVPKNNALMYITTIGEVKKQ